jgi:PLP dependent protein
MATDAALNERLAAVHERIDCACGRVNRSAGSVMLIAVTKTQPVELVQALINLGVKHLGENRVTEIVEKTPYLSGDFTMHLIGHLQTNKVARVLPFVQMIQSIDRERLIGYLERYLPAGVTMPVLVEVNTSGEASKSGCTPQACRMVVERLVASDSLLPSGYMTIGPLGSDERTTRGAFSLLRETAEKNRDLVPEPQLSMGMSGDFEWAIEEGATMVRIGTLLTGERA